MVLVSEGGVIHFPRWYIGFAGFTAGRFFSDLLSSSGVELPASRKIFYDYVCSRTSLAHRNVGRMSCANEERLQSRASGEIFSC